MKRNHVLINCGLIHQYLVREKDIQKIEDKALYTVKVIKDLSDYKIENKGHKIILSNGIEKLVFKKTDGDNNIFKYFLDE